MTQRGKTLLSCAVLNAFVALLSTSVWAIATKAPENSRPITPPCTKAESWQFNANVSADAAGVFKNFLSGKISSARGLAEALAIRRFAKNSELKTISEYFISRSLYEAGMVHSAHAGFLAIASKNSTAETRDVNTAALSCLNRIYDDHPALFSKSAGNEIVKNFTNGAAFRKFALRLLIHSLDKTSDAKKALEILPPNSVERNYGAGLLSASSGDFTSATKSLDLALRLSSSPHSALTPGQVNTGHLMLARAYYSLGRFDEGLNQLKQISKNSNELAKSLSELSWHYLLANKYNEAIGTAISLQSGVMRRTFTPEALMVMAMALNEICQYPDSIRAISLLRQKYESSYKWLSRQESNKNSIGLYKLALAFVKKDPSIPEKVGIEWLRSPIFISSQDEINLLFEERDAQVKMGKQGYSDKKLLAQAIVKLIGQIKPKIFEARRALKPGDDLPPTIRQDLGALKQLIRSYERLKAAAPVWNAIRDKHQLAAPKIEHLSIQRIEKDLARRNQLMLLQLNEIAENNQLIEVEIYNGASQDIIWQNAHPDYKKIAETLKKDGELSGERTWNWGDTKSLTDENAEIWEDELGSFKANLFDNCSSKERYIAIKRRGHGRTN